MKLFSTYPRVTSGNADKWVTVIQNVIESTFLEAAAKANSAGQNCALFSLWPILWTIYDHNFEKILKSEGNLNFHLVQHF